ncbi:hypothetical protein COO91_03044 [Nostoc flagelliforme CCNUN1]|uniref:Uncharacterized protein n=1 Tax=Nostoc flagelliforme CCNUN1 TaxID=2038116 RepID=A0A2K8SNU1_9NOSO|nr:hypothetical protein COO91_03044 [Nostoc flagelliforme CCNUN1]
MRAIRRRTDDDGDAECNSKRTRGVFKLQIRLNCSSTSALKYWVQKARKFQTKLFYDYSTQQIKLDSACGQKGA